MVRPAAALGGDAEIDDLYEVFLPVLLDKVNVCQA